MGTCPCVLFAGLIEVLIPLVVTLISSSLCSIPSKNRDSCTIFFPLWKLALFLLSHGNHASALFCHLCCLENSDI